MQALEDRFWSKVDKNGPVPADHPELGPCWLWTAGKDTNGYGQFSTGKRLIQAHRFALELVTPGPLGPLKALHRCDVKACVNNEGHLYAGTSADNTADWVRAQMRRGGRTRPAPTPFSKFRLDFTPMAQRRRYLGITQAQLARAVGVHPVTMNRTERNRSEPTFSQMLSYARALGTPLHLLYTVVE